MFDDLNEVLRKYPIRELLIQNDEIDIACLSPNRHNREKSHVR